MKKPDLQQTLSSFLAQRVEMGDTEWIFESDGGALECLERLVRGDRSRGLELRKAENRMVEGEMKRRGCADGGVTDDAIAAGVSLGELYDTVCGCMRCPLGATRTNFVFGDGNPDADVMFIGEAPGADEDAQGKPFVGRAGKLLTRMIEAMKLRREDVYIGNILKCRPPNNRDPLADEIEMCEPILIRQIEIIQPHIICALGRISGQTLLRTKSSLSALRGKVHDYHGVKFVVTYHPAALLRNPNWKRGAWDDLKMVRREYDGLEL